MDPNSVREQMRRVREVVNADRLSAEVSQRRLCRIVVDLERGLSRLAALAVILAALSFALAMHVLANMYG